MDLAVGIFKLTDKLPNKENYGLTSQIRRSALSVSGNLSEGFGRKHAKDKVKFYYNSRGSLAETKNHLIYGHQVGYFTELQLSQHSKLTDEIWKELNSLIQTLRSRI